MFPPAAPLDAYGRLVTGSAQSLSFPPVPGPAAAGGGVGVGGASTSAASGAPSSDPNNIDDLLARFNNLKNDLK